MMELTLTLDVDRLIALALGLMMFGIGFNAFVEWLERRPLGHHGYTAFLVVIGVAVTVLASWPIIGFKAVLTLIVAFLASGIPMVVGSIARYMRERDADAEALAYDARERVE
jgi:hypothetical protein